MQAMIWQQNSVDGAVLVGLAHRPTRAERAAGVTGSCTT